jgi:ferritin-like metal-binding protein YciE
MGHHLEDLDDEKFRDPVLLASMQKIEHYCIAAWGTAAAMGRLLGQQKVVKTMEQVLTEGKQFDDQMTRLAEDEVNPRMLEGNEGEEDDEEQEGSSHGRRGSRRKSH